MVIIFLLQVFAAVDYNKKIMEILQSINPHHTEMLHLSCIYSLNLISYRYYIMCTKLIQKFYYLCGSW